ncbi:MAG: uracil phosphoribosyltransferase [Myxococcota bacterium]
MATVHLLDHPLILHKLSVMRRVETSTNEFRRLLKEISMMMAFELSRDLPMTHQDIATPIAKMSAPFIEGQKLVVISILRAGTGILDGMLEVIPSARVGHIGMYRDEVSLQPVEYYFKVPEQMHDREVIVVDPMLATGNSAAAAVARIKETEPKRIKFACLLAAPEGIETFHAQHPDVDVYTPSIDMRLNEKGYIVPGLGDAGDRLYGTK